MNKALLFILPLALLLPACEPGPRDLNYGNEECAHCMMRVSDRAFGSQMVTMQGRNYAFDSVECLAAHVERGEVEAENIHSIWVPNFADPEGDWLEAESAVYLQSEEINSPMGMGITSFADRVAAEEFRAEYTGTIYDWDEVRQLVRGSNLLGSHRHQLDDLEISEEKGDGRTGKAGSHFTSEAMP